MMDDYGNPLIDEYGGQRPTTAHQTPHHHPQQSTQAPHHQRSRSTSRLNRYDQDTQFIPIRDRSLDRQAMGQTGPVTGQTAVTQQAMAARGYYNLNLLKICFLIYEIIYRSNGCIRSIL